MDDLAKTGPTPRFQILALDGGGIKGLFAAATLAAIEEDCGTAVADHFDLIAGTSTGGIIAVALGIGKRPREIVDFYLSNGRRIFPQTFGLTWLRHWFRAKFSPDSLEAVLQECLGDRLFGQSQKRLVIPAYSLGEDDVYVFRTPHVEHLSRDYRVPAWKVAVATSSSPTYFPTCRHVDRLRLIDGGVWANNPTMVGIIEAAGALKIPLDAIRVLSIGTSDAVADRSRRLNNGGKLAWARGNDAIDVILRGQSIAVCNQATFLLGKNNVFRLNPRVPAGQFSLDGTHNVDDLIGKAAHQSRSFMPTFREHFLSHKAQPYSPLHS